MIISEAEDYRGFRFEVLRQGGRGYQTAIFRTKEQIMTVSLDFFNGGNFILWDIS